MSSFAAFLAGLVFGTGLLVSGMSNPAKVLGFLDLAGRWDPTLLVVMAALVGLCPAPAIVAVGAGRAPGFVFTIAMLAGMAAFVVVERMRTHVAPEPVAGDA